MDAVVVEDLDGVRYGYALLRMLELDGWAIDITTRGVRVTKPDVGEVQCFGLVSEVASDLFVEARALQRRALLEAAD